MQCYNSGYDFWLFDTPRAIQQLAMDRAIALKNTQLFYYEFDEMAFHAPETGWRRLSVASTMGTHVRPPDNKRLAGFDIATFSTGHCVECSPLSCNGLAADIPTNSHCLFDTFPVARHCLESGQFSNTEPGPFRIIGVHAIVWP